MSHVSSSNELKIPATVWALGWVSLCMDLSSELVHSLLPLFLVGSLGASALTVGLIDGIAEATAMLVKTFSGAVSDYIGRRKGLLLLGYGLAALSKPLFPLAHTVEMVFVARFLDRIGKGIRGAPRDALVADVAPAEIRGSCFGLRQSMDTVGAFLGPLLAIGLMIGLQGNIPLVLWFSVIPAGFTVVLLLIGVQEPPHPKGQGRFRWPLHGAVIRLFPASYWWVVLIGAVFTLARFSEAFLVLRAQQLGLPNQWVPLVMLVMALSYTLSAYPVGRLSDRLPRSRLLLIGILLLVVADLILARWSSLTGLLLGVALWGLHMGFSQGVLAALVADTTPPQAKGTAYALFNLASGSSLLVASGVAGWLWDHQGSGMTFEVGALLAALAGVLLVLGRSRVVRH